MPGSPLLELHAQNFRSLRKVEVPLGPLKVLVGPNGAGKTNLLSVIAFLGDSARYDLNPAIESWGGFDDLRFRGARGSIRLKILANVTTNSTLGAPDEYELSFNMRGVKRRNGEVSPLLIREETFWFKRTQGRGRRIRIEGSDIQFIDQAAQGRETVDRELSLQKDSLALSTLPRLADTEGGKEVRKIAELFTSFRVSDPDVSRARLPSLEREYRELREDASNLASFLQHLEDAYPDVFALLEEDALSVIPGFRGLYFRHHGGPDMAVSLEIKEAGLPDTTPLGRASFGTVRALALLAMLHDPEPPMLTCVEEVDHGLHPYAFDILVERLRERHQYERTPRRANHPLAQRDPSS